MSMIQADRLTFSYPGSPDPVFQDASFQIDTDWRLGLVGRNGRGKTTLLRLLMKEYPWEGSLVSSVPFDYFPCPVPDQERLTAEVLEELCPEAEGWRFPKELSLLGVEEEALWRPFSTLSNGERTKALLAALFLREGRFPLIDEPTNHLDAQGRALAAAYLRRQRGFILVSHDRRFLDGCVDHILALNRADIQVQAGSYSSWRENFDRVQQFEEAKNERLQKDVRRLQKAARRTSVWSDRVEASKIGAADKGYVGHKSAKMMKRAKALEARQEKALEEKQGLLKNRETAEALKLSPLAHHAKRLVSCSELTLWYGDRKVCGPLAFSLEQGERIALEGRNGSGKSSFLKLLLGQDIRYEGTLVKAPGLKVSYVPQDTSFLRGPLGDFILERGIDESLFKAILRKLGFSREQFDRPLEDYSGGQKKKVLIAASLCEQAHLYVWDEPLNFIDIDSRLQIEELLRGFAPTMIFVEHDRAFQEAVATKTVSL
ncbi:ribosomal protection-like ABC-F family protein [Oscillibacter sp.]|uniref:ribosomal protection-like ABC-F family protein n=1 Tax=Oscillibacter sp. TaxID=1945593 RepID=UPI002D80FC96|nr:ABC-F type ribosomal protection protein [Oscillibacter sp.]